MIGAIHPAFFAVDAVDRELADFHEGHFGVGDQDEFAVLAVEVHLEIGRQACVAYPQRFAVGVLQLSACVKADDIHEVRTTEGKLTPGGTLGYVLEHEQNRLVFTAERIRLIAPDAVKGRGVAAILKCAGNRDGASPVVLGPVRAKRNRDTRR